MAVGVTFVIPVLNEERRLPRCLESIRSQDYPQHSIEIIVADGGSEDRTVAVARRYGARIVANRLRLAEPGVVLGMQLASNDCCAVLAADNVLPHAHWLQLMVRPLEEDPDIGVAFTKVVNAPDDNPFNRYFNDLHADPLNAFVFRCAAKPEEFSRLYPSQQGAKGFTVFTFDADNFPLLALAQGTLVRRRLLAMRRSKYDDILPIIQLIQDRVPMAYVPTAGIYHFSMGGFADFIHKFRKRTKYAIEHGYVQRLGYLTRRRKVYQIIWVLYSITVLPSLLDAFRLGIRRRHAYYAFHAPANLVLVLIVLVNVLVRMMSRLLSFRSDHSSREHDGRLARVPPASALALVAAPGNGWTDQPESSSSYIFGG